MVAEGSGKPPYAINCALMGAAVFVPLPWSSLLAGKLILGALGQSTQENIH